MLISASACSRTALRMRHVAAEREAGQPQRIVRADAAHPGDHRGQIVAFAMAIVVGAFELPAPRKLKRTVSSPDSRSARSTIVTTLLCMVPPCSVVRMADHRHAAACLGGHGDVADGFELAGGAVEHETGGRIRKAGGSAGSSVGFMRMMITAAAPWPSRAAVDEPSGAYVAGRRRRAAAAGRHDGRFRARPARSRRCRRG